MPATRREFIKTVILSAGAVFVSWNDVFSSVPASKNPSVTTASLHFSKAHELLRDGNTLPQFPYHAVTTDTVIIGGGAAGLAAAWKLKKLGRDFLLLENEPAIGGVMKSPIPQWQGIPYPLGSTYFYRYNDLYREFYNDIGVHPIETGEDALYLGKNGIFVDWWNPRNLNSLPLPVKDKDAFKKFRDILLVMPIPSYPLSAAFKDVIKKYDSISAAEYVERCGSHVLTDTMDMYARSVLGAPLKEVNAYSFLNFYSLEFGDAYQIPCYTFAGGLGEIAIKGSQYLGKDHVQTNALVVNVRNEKDNVVVNYIDLQTGASHTVHARNAIVATQKQIAKHIVKDLPEEQVKAISAIRYAPYITIALCCSAPLFPKRAFDFWISDEQRRFTDLIDVTSAPDMASGCENRTTGDFIYMLSSPRPESDRKNMQDDRWLAEFAQKTAQALAAHISDATNKIDEMHVFGWGHSMVIPTVGSHQKLYPLTAQSVGNIHFANSDNDLAPGIENALDWGFRIADDVLKS